MPSNFNVKTNLQQVAKTGSICEILAETFTAQGPASWQQCFSKIDDHHVGLLDILYCEKKKTLSEQISADSSEPGLKL